MWTFSRKKRKGEEYGDKVKVTFPFETFPQKMRALGKYERYIAKLTFKNKQGKSY